MDEWIGPTTRLALPLVLATLSETFAERGGIVNLSIEGTLSVGALVAYLVAAGQGAEALPFAIAAAAIAGATIGGVHACFSVGLRADMIVTGTALHLICLGACGVMFETGKRSGSVTTFGELDAPWSWTPWIGTLLLVSFGHWLLTRTAFGLRLRAAGEAPEALRASGHSPARARWSALCIAGALAGLAGASLTCVLTSEYVEGMTAGRGFLALGLVLFARWQPVGALVAGLFLGLAFAIELHLSTRAAFTGDSAGRDFLVFAVRALPYALAVAALALVPRRRLRTPAALGRSHCSDP